jgi:D-3-phosphoglycerate dehydrogenase / 2-oxoglutarate reductase
MARVLISDKLEPEGVDLLNQAGLELDNRPGLTGNNLQEALRAADGVIIRSGTRITGDLLEQPGKLRVIVRAGVGVDNIDVAAATRKGIVVMNTPGGNTYSTAEHTLALIYSLVRLVPAAVQSVKSGKWEKGKFIGAQLAGKTLGILGLGRIGREVAKRALAMEMKVIGYDPVLAADRAAQLGIEALPDIDSVLTRCDILTVHIPFTEQTRNLIGANELARMKKGARLINCARGGLVNESALAEALQSGHLAGAAIDVFETEPPPADHPLLKLPNVVCTPHLGASTVEAQRSVAIEAAQLLVDYLKRGVVQFAVNMAAVDKAELQELKHYLDMARRLGLLHAQMDQGGTRRVTLHYRGDVADRNTKLLTAAFAAGLLETRLAENVNIVNAELLARERGIEIVEQKNRDKGDFSTLIRAEVQTDKDTYIAAATLFGKQYLRLVNLGPFHLDAYLDGILLVFTHRDMPGLIGHIGTVFGKHNVNIAQMNVGRQVAGGEAIAILNLDNPPPEAALTEVRAHAQIHNVCLVKLPPAGEMPPWLG